MNGVERIAAERERQIAAKGWTADHDLQHSSGVLAMAACYYALPWEFWIEEYPVFADRLFQETGWEARYAKRDKCSFLRRLEIAGALIAAEIDRELKAEALVREWEEENAS